MDYNTYKSPIGMIYFVFEANHLVEVFLLEESFEDYTKAHVVKLKECTFSQKVQAQLEAYFAGKRTTFTVPLKLEGTLFRKQVWEKLLTIPYGETWSYKQLAEAIGNPKAVRAVGGANRANPLPIFVPCHRVIGVHQKCIGYMGHHTDVQEKLLALEKRHVQELLRLEIE